MELLLSLFRYFLNVFASPLLCAFFVECNQHLDFCHYSFFDAIFTLRSHHWNWFLRCLRINMRQLWHFCGGFGYLFYKFGRCLRNFKLSETWGWHFLFILECFVCSEKWHSCTSCLLFLNRVLFTETTKFHRWKQLILLKLLRFLLLSPHNNTSSRRWNCFISKILWLYWRQTRCLFNCRLFDGCSRFL